MADPTDVELQLCPPGQPARRITLVVADLPGVEWLAFAVPADQDYLDDPGRTPRTVALEVAAEARQTAERIVYDAVLQRRRDAR